MKFPDYSFSNLNLVHSILKYYGVKTNRDGLKVVDEILNTKKYKKIVLLVMDGMGHYNLRNHNPNSFLCQKDIGPISTIYPSTTVAAMTMYESGKPSFESGWVSWSTYFKSINRSIDLFTGKDSLSQEIVNFPYKNLISYESIYKKIRKENPNLDIYQFYPEKINKDKEPCFQLKYLTFTDLIDKLTNLCNDEKEKFIFAYCDQPDALMHMEGPSSKKVNLILDEINDLINVFYKQIDDETLVLISADHGQVDITKTYFINEYKELMDMLVMPPLLEGRVRSFFVKKEYLEEFPLAFSEIFGDDFILCSKEDIRICDLFGDGEEHELFEDSIGDYLAIAVKNAVIDYISPFFEYDGFVFKGHHAGLAKEEMQVPLIVLKKDD